ncbi:MAG: thioester reductase domain-containing protein [Pseudomonadota bacterium]|nr:thioester reductase domain-containing protein [Pseudomonadota bacterium]
MSRFDTLVAYLDHWSAAQPDTVSQRFLDIDGQEVERYTFGSFAERTAELAAFLTREAGLARGDRALLVYPPGLELNVAFFACARIGAIPVPVAAPTPMNLEAGVTKLAYVARDSGARVVLSTRTICQGYQLIAASQPRLAAFMPTLPWIATEESRGFGGQRVDDTPISTLFLQYTSGSTSDPKGVIVSHENVIRNGHATLDRHHVAVSWLPQHHDMGFIGYYLYLFLVGGTTHGFSPADFLRKPSLWLRMLSREGGTHTSGPNFAYDYCLRQDRLPDSELEGVDLSRVSWMATAAEPVRAATVERFLERFGPYGLRRTSLVGGYGLAEFTLSVSFGGRQILTVNKQALQNCDVRIEKTLPENNNQVRLVSCGRPVPETTVRIVDPTTHEGLGEAQLGEIWLAGSGKGGGYWQRPELSEAAFAARIKGESAGTYLRTGDLGFVHEGEVFVCGRLKDMIIVRGVNYYPHDIEALVESVCPEVRTGCIAAFPVDDHGDGPEGLVVVAELRDPNVLPDPAPIARALRARYYVDTATVVLVPPKTIPKTTSGKVSRHRAREAWESGAMTVLARHTPGERAPAPVGTRFRYLTELYGLTGAETCPLTDVGVDSIVLVQLIGDVKAMLAEHGAGHLADAVDTRLVQRLTVAELFGLVARFEADPEETIAALSGTLTAIRGEYDAYEAARMRADTAITLPSDTVEALARSTPSDPLATPLLTGATGFLGPFLVRALLRHTAGPVRLLVRADSPHHGMARVVASLARARILIPALEADLRARAEVICGDLARPRLGLDEATWARLADEGGAIVHNGALVNYIMSYDALRGANVEGTRELIHLAAQRRGTFHLVSSTFMYGWMVTPVVDEAERNPTMANLDFGYSQSKWVGEQQTYAAAAQGLDVRVYRPSLVAPTAAGFGSREDVLLRLFAFMIAHGVAVHARNQVSLLPADLVADHIVALAAAPGRSEDTYNITTDHYYTSEDITRRMTELYGFEFEYLEIPAFVVEMNRRCTPKDTLYPLVDFFNRSHKKILAMADKRYANDNYRRARAAVGIPGEEPPLDTTVRNLVAFMRASGMIQR